MNVIPAIDLRDGRCVRLMQGDFERSTEYSDDPAAVARRFEALGTTDLHVVDLDGAQTGVQDNRDIVSRITAATHLAVQVGGGVRDQETLQGWFDAGVARCVVGSLAVIDPDTVKSWLARFGGDRIVLALDVRIDGGAVPRITTHGWTRGTDTTVFEAIRDFRDAGVRHVLCTDVSRDGALAGPNITLYRQIMNRFPGLALQASGGVRDVDDLRSLRDHDIPAAITGRALLEGRITAAEMRTFRRNA
jgi:phosphoribosylformimino-5-aminoimidazole carboxamide ribotide isomerase